MTLRAPRATSWGSLMFAYATLSGWSGYDGDIASVSIDGTVTTVELTGGIRKRFELDTGTNLAREL